MALWNLFQKRRVRDCRRRAEARPDDPQAQFELGAALEAAGQPRDAVRAFEATLTLSPGSAEAHFNLGILYEGLADGPAAIRHMVQAGNLFAQRQDEDNRARARKKLNELYRTFKTPDSV